VLEALGDAGQREKWFAHADASDPGELLHL
jgi:hypothetical protein